MDRGQDGREEAHDPRGEMTTGVEKTQREKGRRLRLLEMDLQATSCNETAMLWRLEDEARSLEEHKERLASLLAAASTERQAWQTRLDAVDAARTAEVTTWAAFTAKMQADLIESAETATSMASQIEEEQRYMDAVLQPQRAEWATKVLEAKSEIQETKSILLDMEKKKRLLLGQLQQAQLVYNELRAREENARATYDVHAMQASPLRHA
ncbi:hypothetical protein SDRG_08717 [Saprolegnia diclina VS20]|uniref:Uncharacterized protein n=1 Tax=Saprolegnia diclina (strain VS20) TaxID=1156394 RepID=T0QFV4_SAPDV|nr:hypothetical protein SDRG_08717 [Saprolegnia diclina VS20]EQC33611.1 hypothetical protein SDRG_08717 [Saprolegnia diclina VS20]|eukprot:XP_008612834.1 hypothetical protein SDRG_08717 [Saprolegnia diclina VS20]